jgi:hypothetical protein
MRIAIAEKWERVLFLVPALTLLTVFLAAGAGLIFD